jgi:hypothetical protein
MQCSATTPLVPRSGSRGTGSYVGVQAMTVHNDNPDASAGPRRCVSSTTEPFWENCMSLNVSSKIEGTLFNIATEKRKTNGPVMEGQFQITGENGKINGAAWTKEANPKPGDKGPPTRFLSLQIEISRDLKYYGAIFATKEKKSDNSPDYYGTLNLTREKNGPELRIAGWKRVGKETGVPFISIVIEPPKPKEGQAAQQQRDPFEHQASDLPI